MAPSYRYTAAIRALVLAAMLGLSACNTSGPSQSTDDQATKLQTPTRPAAGSGQQFAPRQGIATVSKVTLDTTWNGCTALRKLFDDDRDLTAILVGQRFVKLRSDSPDDIDCTVMGRSRESTWEFACNGFAAEQHRNFAPGAHPVSGRKGVLYSPYYGSFIWLHGKCLVWALPAVDRVLAMKGSDADVAGGQAAVDAALALVYQRAA